MMRVINKKSEVEKNQLNNTKTNKKNSNSSNKNRIYRQNTIVFILKVIILFVVVYALRYYINKNEE